MTRRLLWKLCWIIGLGTISLFYVINIITSHTEDGMSYIEIADRQQINDWSTEAEKLYLSGDKQALKSWLDALKFSEKTWAGVLEVDLNQVAGSDMPGSITDGVLLGRDVSWKIHLYFSDNPIMEVTFSDGRARFLIQLPDRMRPGSHLGYVSLALQIILPMMLLIPLTFVLYNHIMSPLRRLERATRSFSEGQFDVRVSRAMGRRNDELTQLANAFDSMASRISELIISQRQLIADLSHELRTPLTRLEISINNLLEGGQNSEEIQRVDRESKNLRKLVEDTLTLAWLENEERSHKGRQLETVDLVDLMDVLLEDATYEFSDRRLAVELPESAPVKRSNHRAVGQALENILRNAFRFTPARKTVSVTLAEQNASYLIFISDQGPGVPKPFLEKIFRPFFRVEGSREARGGFGLGLALAKRQLESVNATVYAENGEKEGLRVVIELPKDDFSQQP
ncbi:two-component system sensor histidine kinase PfeS [Arenicella sp. 4NH20-0111]|uniref:HAMP domain-containing sensor histidine kinase n=1 Tax=Arenicella sp. 4NH20-0111 TaxID=3127648 RepID=UPI003108DD96